MNYPGILFFKQPHVEHITSSEATISLMEDMGISIHVPQDSLRSSEDALDVLALVDHFCCLLIMNPQVLLTSSIQAGL